MPVNSWKEGQEISCHENIAAEFIKRGIATDGEVPKTTKEPKAPKTTKEQ